MNLKEFLNEEYEELKTILVNPTKQELLKFFYLIKKRLDLPSEDLEFRYVIDKKSNIYLGASYFILHDDLEKKSGEKILYKNTGYIKYKDGKIIDPIGRIKNNKNLKKLTESSLNEETDPIFDIILKNPTRQEFLNLVKEMTPAVKAFYNKAPEEIEFRFILDEKDNIYIAPGYSMIHYEMFEKISKRSKRMLSKFEGYMSYDIDSKKFKLPMHSANIKKALRYDRLKKFIGNDYLKESLNEEFSKILETILINPSKKDLVSLVNKFFREKAGNYERGDQVSFRFILDHKGNVYVGCDYALLHDNLINKAEKIRKNTSVKFKGYIDYHSKDNVLRVLNYYNEPVRGEIRKEKNIKKLVGYDLNENLNEEVKGEILKNPSVNAFRSFLKDSRNRFKKHSFYKNKERDNSLPFRFIINLNDIYIASSFDYIHDQMAKKIRRFDSPNKWSFTSFGEFDIPMIKNELIIKPNQLKKLETSIYFKKIIKSFSSLNENLAYVKFKYDNYKNDKVPRVKVLDTDYPGIKGQKTYGSRKDMLGWNLNYFNNKRYAKRAIDDIESFAKLLSANKDEVYKRIKYFFPEQAKFIRRYMKKHIRGLKQKKGILWRNTTYPNIKKFNKESF